MKTSQKRWASIQKQSEFQNKIEKRIKKVLLIQGNNDGVYNTRQF